ncbi:MAG: sarcosine oxidase subunit gamma [Chloroflexi bacterium]|nr:sarcosine oxidase subunit gamma [Chloroflexota bacterium]
MALSGRIALSGGIALPGGAREVPFLSQIDLRVDPTDAVSMTAVAATLGFTVPTVPDSVAGIGDLHALWLGPDEWLVVGRPGRARELEDRLRAALSVPRADAAAVSATLAVASVVDISANRTTIELAGSSARELLEAGCPIDLHPRAFGPGRCAQTLLARANVIVWQTIDEPLYRLLVRPSFGAYVAAWLLDAASGI